jgi:serine/threonine protein kinase
MNDPQRQTVGPWALGERLGRGGNATVWEATQSGSTTAVALKLINTTKVEREPYQRFVREIEFLRDHQDIPGLLPLLDAHLPGQPDKTDQPWLEALDGCLFTPPRHFTASSRCRRSWPYALRLSGGSESGLCQA